MADSRKLVTLDILDYYDTNIKEWTLQQMEDGREIIFARKEDFPFVGMDKRLYIDEDKIYIWSTEEEDYKLINNSSGTTIIETLKWEEF